MDEQLKIVDSVRKECASIDKTVAATKQEINLLQEYRTRLIADVVTGKLDIREAAANIPDELENVEDELEPEEVEMMDEDEAIVE